MASKLIVSYASTLPGFGRITGSDLPPRQGQWVVQRLTTVPVAGIRDGVGFSYGPVLFKAETSGACFDWIAEN